MDSYAPKTQREIQRILQMWAECRELYGGEGPWLFGQLSVADILYTPVALRFITYAIDVPPKARQFVDAVYNNANGLNWIADAAEDSESCLSMTIFEYQSLVRLTVLSGSPFCLSNHLANGKSCTLLLICLPMSDSHSPPPEKAPAANTSSGEPIPTVNPSTDRLDLPPYGWHLLLCADQTKPKCCSKPVGLEAWNYLKKRIRELQLDRGPLQVHRTKANCLRGCDYNIPGPVLMVYPGGFWYRSATPEAIERILQEHILGGKPVGELLVGQTPLVEHHREKPEFDAPLP